MTASIAALGLVPMLIGGGVGGEIPKATSSRCADLPLQQHSHYLFYRQHLK